MSSLWYRGWHWLCARIYFERITVLHPERLPQGGPVLYIGLHRNGAVDGFVYRQVAPRSVFLISTQLLRSLFARLFFEGIAVARTKDEEDRSRNAAALRQCHDLLAAGGALFVFPEGTSSLGPCHLPFKSGAAQIALDYLATARSLRIVPLGIHYERAWAYRRKVEVVVGNPISTDLDSALSSLGRLKELKRRMTTALEAVGTNFNSAAEQERAERLAYAATLGTTRSFFDSLKALEAGVPGTLVARWLELEPELASRRVWLHQGVPLFPTHAMPLYALLLAVLGPVLLAGALANLPPLLAGWFAGKKFADERNVIALWRILVGLPLLVIWFAATTTVLAICAGGIWAMAYAALTLLALKFFYRTKKLAVAVFNGLAHRSLRDRMLALHQTLLRDLPPE